MKILSMIWGILPDDYKWSVAIKKATWTIAKTGVAILAGTKIGKTVPPEHWAVVSDVSAALLAGGMKVVHDWAKVKWPEAKWL